MLLLLKLIHIFFVISFMAGVFYLPRIIVHYKLACENDEPIERLIIMTRRLFIFSLIIGSLAVMSGLMLAMAMYSFNGGWIWLKLIVVVLMFCYFCYAGSMVVLMPQKKVPASSRFWRIYNEFGLLFLLVILYLVIYKPLID